jgi:hypothetical protein
MTESSSNHTVLSYKDDISWLIETNAPMSVAAEVRKTTCMHQPDMDFTVIEKVYLDVLDLFDGRYPGYKACTTKYHDLKHTTDVYLALACLLNGYSLCGVKINERSIRLGLISAIMHDVGYIQSTDENSGTGARFTAVHVERSIEFMEKYFQLNQWPEEDFRAAGRMVIATDLSIKISEIPFENEYEANAARALFVADLLGQMADRVYLEKLMFLYLEFSEAGIMDYSSENDLLRKTTIFYETIWERLKKEANYKKEHMASHFEKRFNIPHDLYAHSAQKNIAYLKHILKDHDDSHREMLNRGGIVGRLMKTGDGKA